MTASAPVARSAPVAAIALIVAMVATAVTGILGSHLATWIFVVAAGLLVAEAALASLRWPRAALVGVVLSPILDRYLVPGLLAPDAEILAHLLSESLLLAVGVALVAQALRRSSLRAALEHSTVRLALVFVVLASISAAVNAVPAGQALAGIGFTVDAVALFVMARLVRFDTRRALMSINVLVGLALAAAVVAVAQAVLSPHLLGLSALQGRFGEVYRLAAFFGDPNVFAAFLTASIPFALFGATGLWTARGRRLALGGGFLLVLALWLSFSRGGWLGALAGFAIAAVLLDRRALRLGLVVVPVALVVALVMPRDLICRECEARPDLVGSTVGRVGTVSSGKDLRTSLVANAVPIILDHPLVGVGPGRYGGAAADLFGTSVYAAYGTDRLFTNPSQRTVDNFWLHLAVESGLLGLLAYLGMIGAALRPIMRSARTAAWGRRVALAGISGAVIGLSINGLTTMLLEANSVAFLFWFLLGIGSQLARLELPADGNLPQGAQNEPKVEPE
jgi:O-antigen ligase